MVSLQTLKNLWAEIVATVLYLKNCSPTSALDNKMPFEAWHGEKPDLSHLHILGCDAYVHVPKEKRVKLDSHTEKGQLVGYKGMNQWKAWIPMREEVVVSRDVVFDKKKGNELIELQILDSIKVLCGPPPPALIATAVT